MKPFLLFSILLFLFSACSSNLNGWEIFELRGKVKSLSETNYKAELTESGRWKKREAIGDQGTVSYFSETGDYLSMERFIDGDLTEISLSQFDENGHIKGWVFSDSNQEITGEQKIIKETNRFREMEGYDNEGNLISRHQQYLRWGRVVSDEITYLGPQQEIHFEIKNQQTYTRSGRLHTVVQTIDGEPSFSSIIEYSENDERGNWIRKIAYSNDDDPAKKGVGLITIRTIEYY